MLGSGFAAHYSDAIWTNAHVARGLLDALDELSHLNPRPIAVRAGTVIGGSDTYDLTRYIMHHNYDGTTNSPDIGILISDTDLPSLASFLPREHATGPTAHSYDRISWGVSVYSRPSRVTRVHL